MIVLDLIKIWWNARKTVKRIKKCLEKWTTLKGWEEEWKAACTGQQGSRYVAPDVPPRGKTARAKRGKSGARGYER